ncbi:MAG: DUF3352 domain-containing protein [Cyanophyceae cyanobacterium]
MNRRVFCSALSIVAGALLSTAIAGAIWVSANNPLTLLEGMAGKEPIAAQFIPRTAPVMVSLLANPDRLENLRQVLVPPSERRAASREWRQVRDRLLSKTKLDYERDIQPWLGDEVTFAVTGVDGDRDGDNGQQPAYLLAAKLADRGVGRARAQGFLELFWQKQALAGVNPIFERYKGATITYGEAMDVLPDSLWRSRRRGTAAPRTNLAPALVGDEFVLLATDPKVLREAITNVQVPGQNLASLAAYKQSVALQDNDRRLGVVTADFATLTRLFQPPKTAAAIQNLPASKAFSPFDGAIALVEFDRQGITGNFQFLDRNPSARSEPTLTGPVPPLGYLPRNAAIAIGGENLADLWQGVRSKFAGTLLGDSLITQINQRAAREKLMPETDILPWLTGDYAIGFVDGDWVAVTAHSDDSAAAFQRLDRVAGSRGWTVGTVTLGEEDRQTEAQIWSRLAARGKTVTTQVEGVRAQIDDYDILTTSVAALNKVLAATPNGETQPNPQSFLSRSDVQRNLAQLPQPNDGYVQLDWSTAKPVLGGLFPLLTVLDGVGQPILNRLETITVVSHGDMDAGAMDRSGEGGDRRQITLRAQLSR